MKCFYKLLLVALLFPAFASAQSNYKPGYIVSLNGDTVKGFIDNKGWDISPQIIHFKQNLNSTRQQYSVNDIKAFGITGYDDYRRFEVILSQDKTDLTTTGLDTTKMQGIVFLRQINTGGKVIIYAYADNIKQRFYVSDNGLGPVELIYHQYLDPDKQDKIVTAEGYKIQLQKLVAVYDPHNQKLINYIQTSGYKEDDLRKIAYKINGITNVPGTAYNKPRFFAGVSVINSSTNFTGNIELANRGPSSSTLPGIDFGLDLYFNRSVQKWVLRFELSVAPVNANFAFADDRDPIEIESYVLKYNQIIASLAPQIIYNAYKTKNVGIYISTGFQIHDSIHSTKEFNETTTFSTSKTQYTAAIPFPNVDNFSFNIPVKIGMVLNNRFDIYVGYIPTTTLSNDPLYEIQTKSYLAGFNYIFGEK